MIPPDPRPQPRAVPAEANGPSAEEKLRRYFAAASQNFLEENERIFAKKAAKIQARHASGQAVLAQAERELQDAMQQLSAELGLLRERQAQLERLRAAALEQARQQREETAEEYLRRQEEAAKAAIDREMLRHRR